MKFYPMKKGGEKSFTFSHAEGWGEGGAQRFWGSFYAVAQSFSHIEGGGGGGKGFHSFKAGALKFYPVLGGRKRFLFFWGGGYYFVSHPPKTPLFSKPQYKRPFPLFKSLPTALTPSTQSL